MLFYLPKNGNTRRVLATKSHLSSSFLLCVLSCATCQTEENWHQKKREKRREGDPCLHFPHYILRKKKEKWE